MPARTGRALATVDLDGAAAALASDLALDEVEDALLRCPDVAWAVAACRAHLHACGDAPLPARLVAVYSRLLARSGRDFDAAFFAEHAADRRREEQALRRWPQGVPAGVTPGWRQTC